MLVTLTERKGNNYARNSISQTVSPGEPKRQIVTTLGGYYFNVSVNIRYPQ